MRIAGGRRRRSEREEMLGAFCVVRRIDSCSEGLVRLVSLFLSLSHVVITLDLALQISFPDVQYPTMHQQCMHIRDAPATTPTHQSLQMHHLTSPASSNNCTFNFDFTYVTTTCKSSVKFVIV
jgi:hypothetical protein